MQRYFAALCMMICLAVLPQTLAALTEPASGNRVPAFAAQSQVFVSNTTSLVRQNDGHACMQSAGTDWKTQSRSVTARGQVAVKLETLQSNTPFVSYVQTLDGSDFIRLAFGFRIAHASASFDTPGPGLADIAYEIEQRGDTLLITDPLAIQRVLAALRSDNGLRVKAQSKKLIPSSNEHIVSHLFKLPRDDAGFDACTELAKKTPHAAYGEIQIGLRAAARKDANIAQAKAAACNRDIDPTGAELVALSTLSGVTSPLSHALLKRDNIGQISTIWVGDLIRIERTGSTYQQRISNSINAQGPLAEQSVPACTRMAAPICVTVVENAQGRITVEPCMADLVAWASSPGFGSASDLQNPLSRPGRGAASAGQFGGGGGGGASSSTENSAANFGSSSFDDDVIEILLASLDPAASPEGDDDPNANRLPNPNNAPNVVPLPAGLGLLVFALGLAVGASRRATA